MTQTKTTIHTPSPLGDLYADRLKVSAPRDERQRVSWTLGAMRALVDDAVESSPLAERTASAIATAGAQRDLAGQVQRLYGFLASRVRFRKDTFPAEHLRHPDQLLSEIRERGVTSADCDDLAMLAATLLRCLGFPAYFVVVGKRKDRPFQHVYPALDFGGRIIEMDPQERRPIGPITPYPRLLIVPAQE